MPTRDNIGPVYCERLMNAGVSEPLNFITNIVAVTLAIYLIYRFSNKKEFFPFGIFAGLLLFITGVGSFLWHGYRTPLFLALDTTPGIFLLLSLIFYSYYKTFSLKLSLTYLVLLFVFLSSMSVLLIKNTPFYFFIFMFSSVAFTCLFLIYTNYNNKVNTKYISVAFGLALLAATFRSIDLYVCEIFPLGTHFLWHILLPLAAYFTILHTEILFKNSGK